jgi:hypothetical protein
MYWHCGMKKDPSFLLKTFMKTRNLTCMEPQAVMLREVAASRAQASHTMLSRSTRKGIKPAWCLVCFAPD